MKKSNGESIMTPNEELTSPVNELETPQEEVVAGSFLPRDNIKVFWMPKQGNSELEYEDAYAVLPGGARLAIADGATETSFARSWACELVEAFIAAPPNQGENWEKEFREWLQPLQQSWYKSVDWNTLRGMSKLKASFGACSSLLGLEFIQGCPTVPWSAVAVGDSCLFVIRKGVLLVSFPLEKSELFNNAPLLLSSHPEGNEQLSAGIAVATGVGEPDDLFFLGTDALAAWFLAEYEDGGKPWESLGSLRSADEFAVFVNGLRERGLMRNDDTTLIAACVAQTQVAVDADERECSP